MKILCLSGFLICGLSLLGACKKAQDTSKTRQHVSEKSEVSPEEHRARVDNYFSAMRRAKDRQFYYSFSPSIECLLGFPEDVPKITREIPVLTDAFVISVDSQGVVDVRERILGKVPSDYRTLLPEGQDAGDYLIGHLMPKGGWRTGGFSGRPFFCLPLRTDGSFSYGYEGELKGSLESIRKYK